MIRFGIRFDVFAVPFPPRPIMNVVQQSIENAAKYSPADSPIHYSLQDNLAELVVNIADL